MRRVWGAFFASCAVAGFVLLGIVWPDQFLLWLSTFIPVFLGLVVILVPAKNEDAQTHMRWRYALGVALILYGGLVWAQQTRQASDSQVDRETAIKDTAAQTSADVSERVNKQYQDMIDDLNMQILSLRRQLSDQARDFAAQLKQTGTDLAGSISKVGTAAVKYAELQFKGWSDEQNGPTNSPPTIVADQSGVFTLNFTFMNNSETATGTGDVWLYLCDACQLSEEPRGFDRPTGLNERERHLTFQQLNPGVTMQKQTIKIKINGGPFAWAELSFQYSCAACGKVSSIQTVRYLVKS